MQRHIKLVKVVIVLAALVAVAALIGAPEVSRAANRGTLDNIAADCFNFSLEASFHGTVDEENGFDYAVLRVLDAAGNEIYRSDPWAAPYGETEFFTFSAGFQRGPVAGPLLFVLVDFEQLSLRQMESLASAIVEPDCPTLPQLPPPEVTLTCSVRLRMGPGLNFRWRTFLLDGERFAVIGRLYDASWVQVRTEDEGMLGWVYDGFCVPGSPAAGTFRASPVTFFRDSDEVLQYQFAVPEPFVEEAP